MSYDYAEELRENREGIRYEVAEDVLGRWEVMRYSRSGFGRLMGTYETEEQAHDVAEFLYENRMGEMP